MIMIRIGVVGGLGPYAGIDLVRKIFDQTIATIDQEHLSVALLSISEEVTDRTDFLLGKSKINPAYAIYEAIKKFELLGVEVVGIPCNTSHSPLIFNLIQGKIVKDQSKIKVLNMVKEVGEFIVNYYPTSKNIGVLSTTGTYRAGVYGDFLQKFGLQAVIPNEEEQNLLVHQAIYHPEHGIKAKSNPVSRRAKQNLLEAIEILKQKGAEMVVFGCTELALALPEKVIFGLPIVDSNLVLARALIREVEPEKLRDLILYENQNILICR